MPNPQNRRYIFPLSWHQKLKFDLWVEYGINITHSKVIFDIPKIDKFVNSQITHQFFIILPIIIMNE